MPSYLELYRSGELSHRIDVVRDIMHNCALCPWQCRVNRMVEEAGYCRIGAEALVSSYGPHFGEERPLSGQRGSGAIFLAGCNLRCAYCQNYDISHLEQGITMSARKLSQKTWINLMNQYRPCFAADQHPPLNRRITRLEYKEARDLALAAGLKNLL